MSPEAVVISLLVVFAIIVLRLVIKEHKATQL